MTGADDKPDQRACYLSRRCCTGTAQRLIALHVIVRKRVPWQPIMHVVAVREFFVYFRFVNVGTIAMRDGTV
jgi:hypothetical protein